MSRKIHQILLETSNSSARSLYEVIRLNGVQTLNKTSEVGLFEAMAKIAIGQQLSTSAASSIWARVKERQRIYGADFSTFIEKENAEYLYECGVSKSKVKAIICANTFLRNNPDVEESSFKNYEELKNVIEGIWGFGPWSSEMLAISQYGMKNIWSYSDVSLAKGLRHFVEIEGLDETALLADFEPHHSYLAKHIWLAIDRKLIEV